jgi:hypothetical protein
MMFITTEDIRKVAEETGLDNYVVREVAEALVEFCTEKDLAVEPRVEPT